jgi:ABC-type nitrate/sulfonate/bicarbonate transport system permease component
VVKVQARQVRREFQIKKHNILAGLDKYDGGELSKTIIIFWASLWPVLLNTSSGVKNVDTVLIRSARSMGASRAYIFLRIIIPATAPEIFTGIRLGGSYCVMSWKEDIHE